MRWSAPAGGITRSCRWPSPFSPVPGPRLLVRGVPRGALAGALAQACAELDLSSVHATFCTEEDWQALGEAGWLQRLGTQFHWENAGYADFEAFLAALNARKRKSIRRERRDAQNCGAGVRDAARRRYRPAGMGCVL